MKITSRKSTFRTPACSLLPSWNRPSESLPLVDCNGPNAVPEPNPKFFTGSGSDNPCRQRTESTSHPVAHEEHEAVPEDTEQARTLEDRLVNYADALVAVAFVGASGLGLAVADPDIRVSIVLGGLLSGLIHIFRRWEFELRKGLTPLAAARRYSGCLHWGRLTVVWIAVVQSIGIMLAIR
ncbi:hypothetical protein MK489_24900 [Myxococcota bacterium]|nr:hypothetical protein [Myxococcota bacterium]